MGRGSFRALLLGCTLWGCDLDAGATEGESCVRTSQCQMLLACVEGVCTRDLDSVAEQSSVPELIRDAAAPRMDAMAMDADAAAIDGAAQGEGAEPMEASGDADAGT